MPIPIKVRSIKQRSILEQFHIYFVVASVIPLIILIYILYQFIAGGEITNFRFLIIMATVFSLLGFWGTRSFLVKIVSLTNRLKEDTSDKIDRSTILELAKGEGEVAYLAKLFGGITTKLEENVVKLEETKMTLYNVLSKVGKAISSMENFDELIKFILETVIEALGTKRAAIYTFDEEKNILKLKVALGIDEKDVPQEVRFGEGTVGWVAKEAKPLFIPFLEEKEGTVSLFSPPLIAAPLLVHDKIWGVISVSGKKERGGFSEDEVKIISNLAYQIAVSLENADLNIEIERTYFETISALALAVEAKDPYSRGHSERVTEYGRKMAENLGLAQEDLDILRDAARLHDIGKIGITDDILQKPAGLTSEEKAIMHKHPLIGEEIVKPLRSFIRILNPIKHHHEFLDGSGYPDGLQGQDIPLVTRILTVADIFDALSSDRPYRKAFNIDEVKKELRMMVEKGKLDNNVVDALFKLIEEKKI